MTREHLREEERSLRVGGSGKPDGSASVGGIGASVNVTGPRAVLFCFLKKRKKRDLSSRSLTRLPLLFRSRRAPPLLTPDLVLFPQRSEHDVHFVSFTI